MVNVLFPKNYCCVFPEQDIVYVLKMVCLLRMVNALFPEKYCCVFPEQDIVYVLRGRKNKTE